MKLLQKKRIPEVEYVYRSKSFQKAALAVAVTQPMIERVIFIRK